MRQTKDDVIKKRQEIYNFIVKFFSENGYSPSIREIAQGTKLKSTSSVYNHLMILKFDGKIDMKENTPRTIRLIGYEHVRSGGGVKVTRFFLKSFV